MKTVHSNFLHQVTELETKCQCSDGVHDTNFAS
jgi:hypothetical protein